MTTPAYNRYGEGLATLSLESGELVLFASTAPASNVTVEVTLPADLARKLRDDLVANLSLDAPAVTAQA